MLISSTSIRPRRALLLAPALAAGLLAGSATGAPAATALTGVQLDWGISGELQRTAFNGSPNFFSAGVSDGTEATYAAASTGVQVLQVAADGAATPATWATKGAHTASGGQQRVRLTAGTGSVETDGTTDVAWPGTFSVNVYGGLVPFSVADLHLRIDADGKGRLTGDLSGYTASMANPTQKTPIAPVQDVTITTFPGAHLDATATPVTVTPEFAGVAVTTPAGSAAQSQVPAGWGSWPQPFIDFHGLTGLASYWYTSGGAADAYKAPLPFTVTVTGQASVPTPTATPTPAPLPVTTPTPVPTPQPIAEPAPSGRIIGSKGAKRTVKIQVGAPLGPLATHTYRVRVTKAGKLVATGTATGDRLTLTARNTAKKGKKPVYPLLTGALTVKAETTWKGKKIAKRDRIATVKLTVVA